MSKDKNQSLTQALADKENDDSFDSITEPFFEEPASGLHVLKLDGNRGLVETANKPTADN